ncbi:hypothetical protein [Dyella telluris]|uniref:Uncharacterized protein n=1 Tax=Dyella telluris TaxID=2763498 RepID=A0A7G8Q8D9_9GAMM|nr:hypothetical protein [Dyella telluris]QNK03047.1 hypothetical protein H8F01_08035 [Dyella telluris]
MSAPRGWAWGAMDAWPAWGRWTAALLAGIAMAADFWLLTQQAVLPRLIGLAVFAATLMFMMRIGQAIRRERCRPADRRYMREFLPAMLTYMVVMLYLWPLQKGMPPGALKLLLVLSPMLPIGWAIVACVRYVLAGDEMERQQHLDAIAISASIISMVSMALGFLCAARLLVLDGGLVLLFVYPSLCVVYGVVRAFLVMRARRE